MEISRKVVKKEVVEELSSYPRLSPGSRALTLSAAEAEFVIDISSSDSDSDSSDSDNDVDDGNDRPWKKTKSGETSSAALPLGFLDPLPIKQPIEALPPPSVALSSDLAVVVSSVSSSNSRRFWKAGDYEGAPTGDWEAYAGRMDHVRVHPRFLHSNATSHKWVLGAFAELLDNSLDEVCNGATFVKLDMIRSSKDSSRMLVIEDNGGGMSPDKLRQCMSLGYSVKSKIADTIGQYGNGFKTSSMRLGADVIVFSRSCGEDGTRSTQSIGLLSYTFLRSTGKEDIVVPMLDYERNGQDWNKIIRSSADWIRNVQTIVQWSPFSSEADLLQQLNLLKDRGTRIIIYNLWEDDDGQLELDFDADPYDIQIRGVNRDEKNIQMADMYPNSRHFLTYQHSLRSYASILYLRLPSTFRIILRGKDVQHHNLVNDMMMAQEVTYRPQAGADDGVLKDYNLLAVVTVGFVKDAKAHIDVQGFNLYHKNRLIKPFWRVWHAPGSDGRGVIGVLEANFVEPAHNKQGFERTIVLSRLESRLIQMQRTYWSTYCHKIGYAPRRNKTLIQKENEDFLVNSKSGTKSSAPAPSTGKAQAATTVKDSSLRSKSTDKSHGIEHVHKGDPRTRKSGKEHYSPEPSSPSSPSLENVSDDDDDDDDDDGLPAKNGANGHFRNSTNSKSVSAKRDSQTNHVSSSSRPKATSQKKRPQQYDEDDDSGEDLRETLNRLKEENSELREKLKKKEEVIFGDLLKDLNAEKDKSKSFESQLKEANDKISELNKQQDNVIEVFSEERQRRELQEENLRKRLKDASNTIQELMEKIKQLEKKRHSRG